MPATENLGDNYVIREDSNGDYEIEHNTLGIVLRFSDANDVLSFLKDVEVGDVIDESSGNAVYDSSTETIGDGNQDANLNSVSTDQVVNEGIGSYTAGSDTELTSVLNAVAEGDYLYLGNSNFADNRTIDNRLRITGSGPFTGTSVGGDWTVGNRTVIMDLSFGGGDLILSGSFTHAHRIFLDGQTLTVQGDDCFLTGIYGGDVVFESGTNGGLVDASMTNVTDNGTNNVGDNV